MASARTGCGCHPARSRLHLGAAWIRLSADPKRFACELCRRLGDVPVKNLFRNVAGTRPLCSRCGTDEDVHHIVLKSAEAVCAGCKEKRDILVDDLLQAAARSERACPRGCLISHSGADNRCPRGLPEAAVAVDQGTPSEIAVSLIPGVWDALVVIAAPVDKSRAVYCRLDIKDPQNSAISFPVGFTVHGRTLLLSKVPWSHAITFNPPGIAPTRPEATLKKIAEAFVTDGLHLPVCPTEPFLGIQPAEWKAINVSACASKRFAAFLGGATARIDQAEGSTLRTSRRFRPATTIGHFQAPPRAIFDPEGSGVKCGWCGAKFDGPWAHLRFHQVCAPDAALADARKLQEAPRKRIRVACRDKCG